MGEVLFSPRRHGDAEKPKPLKHRGIEGAEEPNRKAAAPVLLSHNYAPGKKNLTIQKLTAATAAEAGMVRTHAQMIR